MLDQLAQRTAQRCDFRDVVLPKIRSRTGGRRSLAADLQYANNFVADGDRRAHDFPNCFRDERVVFDAFENARMARLMKTVVNFDAIFPRGARGESRWTRERNESDVFQGLRNEEMEVAPFHGDR